MRDALAPKAKAKPTTQPNNVVKPRDRLEKGAQEQIEVADRYRLDGGPRHDKYNNTGVAPRRSA